MGMGGDADCKSRKSADAIMALRQIWEASVQIKALDQVPDEAANIWHGGLK
jgi:hypothetical protein